MEISIPGIMSNTSKSSDPEQTAIQPVSPIERLQFPVLFPVINFEE